MHEDTLDRRCVFNLMLHTRFSDIFLGFNDEGVAVQITRKAVMIVKDFIFEVGICFIRSIIILVDRTGM